MAHWTQDCMIPTKPLLDIVKRKASYHGSVLKLAAYLCHRMNVSPAACANQLNKLAQKDSITLFAADRYLTALGYHVIDVYGWETFARGVDLSDVMTEGECC